MRQSAEQPRRLVNLHIYAIISENTTGIGQTDHNHQPFFFFYQRVNMTETDKESFEELFKAEKTTKIRHLSPGQKIKATIVGINDETTFLDVGGKSEGVLE